MKHIADPKWLALSTVTTKCELQEPAMFRKHRSEERRVGKECA